MKLRFGNHKAEGIVGRLECPGWHLCRATNSSPKASKCRRRKAAMVQWSGCWFPESTRMATSSYRARSILREERMPRQ